MQATLPVRTVSAGWTALIALTLAVAIFVAGAVAFSRLPSAGSATGASSVSAGYEQALVQHRAGERESVVTNSNAVNSESRPQERDEGLGSSINAPSDAKPISGKGRGLIPQ